MNTNVSENEQEQRILHIFQHNKSLPEVNTETLERYFAFLTKNVLFPIQGTFDQETGSLHHITHPVIVEHLSEDIDEFYGIYVEGVAGKKNVAIPLDKQQQLRADLLMEKHESKKKTSLIGYGQKNRSGVPIEVLEQVQEEKTKTGRV